MKGIAWIFTLEAQRFVRSASPYLTIIISTGERERESERERERLTIAGEADAELRMQQIIGISWLHHGVSICQKGVGDI